MALIRTAPVVSPGAEINAEDHAALILAIDEILAERFNKRTFLAFTAQPQMDTGVSLAFKFGSAFQNLQTIATAEYDPADEMQLPPTAGQVVSWDEQTKVVIVTGYAIPPTLNRITVQWKPPTAPPTDPDTAWWLGPDQHFRRTYCADIILEGGATTAFQYRAHWDKFGIIRIHNGNRADAIVSFEGDSQPSITIPPYGITCGRRLAPDEPFVFETYYLPLTKPGDWAKYQTMGAGTAAPESVVGSISELNQIVEAFQFIGKSRYNTGYDSTAREQGSFLGRPMLKDDRVQDWVAHKGEFLSVLLDRRDGAVTVARLQYNGVDHIRTNPWTGQIQVTWPPGTPSSNFILTSVVTPPAGAADADWEHDLIPVSTNLFGTTIVPLKDAPLDLFPLPIFGYQLFNQSRTFSTFDVYAITYVAPPDTVSPPALSFTNVDVFVNVAPTPVDLHSGWDYQLDELGPSPSLVTGITEITNKYHKTGAALAHFGRYKLDTVQFVNLSVSLDLAAEIGTNTLWWHMSIANTHVQQRHRFVAWAPRKYQAAGRPLTAPDVAYDQHPQDRELQGSLDGLNLGPSIEAMELSVSIIRIDSENAVETATNGNDVYAPNDVLRRAIELVETPGWWLANRDRCVAGTLDQDDKLITWRLPRLIEQFNDLSMAVNAVEAVSPVTILDLFYGAPSDAFDKPFTYFGESPFAVPVGWAMGMYENGAGTPLSDFATLWGITAVAGVPSIAAFRTMPFSAWIQQEGSSAEGNRVSGFVMQDRTAPGGETPFETVNGEPYYTSKAWRKENQRYLFGGAGTDSGYVWLRESDLHTIFDPLGVAVPKTPMGFRYQPMLEDDTGGRLVQGTFRVSGIVHSFEILAAHTAWKEPLGTGEWWHAIAPGEHIRIIDQAYRTPSENRYHQISNPTIPPDGVSHVLIWSMDPPEVVGRDGNTNAQTSPRGETPRNTGGTQAWHSVQSISASDPVNVLIWPEEWWDPIWEVSIPSAPDGFKERNLYTQTPPTHYTRLVRIELSEMPITAESLREKTGVDWPCFHLQIWPISGSRRTFPPSP